MPTPDPAAMIAASELVYVSDYFSFVGADEQGRVAFAIDNNRGRDGDAYQADHLYAVLHDERQGWMKIAGVGRYENTKRELLPIPDSPAFQFVGQAPMGITISSPQNHLSLRVEPMIERVTRSSETLIFSLGSAPAVLAWKERTIPGRVIYEYLVVQNFNMLTRRSFKGLAGFQGLYLLAGKEDDLYIQDTGGKGPLFFRTQPEAGPFGPLGLEPLLGFAVFGGQTEPLEQLRFATPGHALALGTYRWPIAWRVSWQGRKGPAALAVTLRTRKQIGNWLLVGFSMGIVTGTLTYDGQQTPLYGLAELLVM